MTNRMKSVSLLVGVLVILAVVVVVYLRRDSFMATRAPETDQLAVLADCIKTQGAVFYGAFWCPHCQNQKSLFGSAANRLPYVECSTPDGLGQLPICTEKKIMGYPTWVFKDGTRLAGETSLADLAAKTGCSLPQ